ncbi:hypothetical protein WMY93_023436 [Mugilogobius chulae]|uniref:Uncharacterized protein n=1 Tax=Mugilogobius chulae TaxID=88201 RepID=A0AAW0NES3_9GOBI
MSEKHRSLPSWMSKKGKKDENVKEPLKSKRKSKVARTVFYCMNEQELVKTAVSYLISSSGEREDLLDKHKDGLKLTAQTQKQRGIPDSKSSALNPAEDASVESSDSGEAQDRTYVSESDVDITEVETVPYPLCTEGNKEQVCKEEKQKVNNDRLSQAAAKDDKKEDDAFQLVREIFFS